MYTCWFWPHTCTSSHLKSVTSVVLKHEKCEKSNELMILHVICFKLDCFFFFPVNLSIFWIDGTNFAIKFRQLELFRRHFMKRLFRSYQLCESKKPQLGKSKIWTFPKNKKVLTFFSYTLRVYEHDQSQHPSGDFAVSIHKCIMMTTYLILIRNRAARHGSEAG